MRAELERMRLRLGLLLAAPLAASLVWACAVKPAGEIGSGEGSLTETKTVDLAECMAAPNAAELPPASIEASPHHFASEAILIPLTKMTVRAEVRITDGRAELVELLGIVTKPEVFQGSLRFAPKGAGGNGHVTAEGDRRYAYLAFSGEAASSKLTMVRDVDAGGSAIGLETMTLHREASGEGWIVVGGAPADAGATTPIAAAAGCTFAPDAWKLLDPLCAEGTDAGGRASWCSEPGDAGAPKGDAGSGEGGASAKPDAGGADAGDAGKPPAPPPPADDDGEDDDYTYTKPGPTKPGAPEGSSEGASNSRPGGNKNTVPSLSEDDGDDAVTPTTSSSKKPAAKPSAESGCSYAPASSSSGLSAFLGLGLVFAAARRRRRGA